MTADIRELTKAYIAAFNDRDLYRVGALLADDFSLTDPAVVNLTPKEKVLEFVGGIFDSVTGDFSFVADTIIVEGQTSVIEFKLTLGPKVLEGVDILEWRDGKLAALRAHLTDRSAGG